MTKTLTEQWCEGTLPDGYYYITSKKWGMLIDRYKDQINDCGNEWRGFDNCQGIIDEVLAPVPSYDEYCNFVFQANKPKNPLSDVMMCYDTEREKKVVEHLQEQLNEANELLNLYLPKKLINSVCVKPINDYRTKWGVK